MARSDLGTGNDFSDDQQFADLVFNGFRLNEDSTTIIINVTSDVADGAVSILLEEVCLFGMSEFGKQNVLESLEFARGNAELATSFVTLAKNEGCPVVWFRDVHPSEKLLFAIFVRANGAWIYASCRGVVKVDASGKRVHEIIA